MIPTEQYAQADLNAIKSFERRQGERQGESKIQKLLSAILKTNNQEDIDLALTADEQQVRDLCKKYGII